MGGEKTVHREMLNCHAEVLRSIWLIRADKLDASEYLSMTFLFFQSAFICVHLWLQ